MNSKYEQYAQQLKHQKLFETEELYQKYSDEYAPVFRENFHRICENIIKLQKNGELEEISYLEYTLLYTDLIQRKETAEVRVYNDNWYFDSKQRIVGDFDFSFLFAGYRELWTELLAGRKRFAGDVTAQEIISYLLSCASQFYKYVTAVCRFSILSCVESEPFLSVKRSDRFEINAGEYMAYTQPVYKENRQRTSRDCLDWLAMRHEYEYAFEDFSCLDFSGADLSEADLRYSDLRRCRLVGTNLQDAMLFGTRFCHADMEGADLSYCPLHESDFTGANLTNACFTAAHAYRGAPWQAEWTVPGYRSVSFRNADLTNADFRKADIRDADFTGAVMNGTMISGKQLDSFSLSPLQKQTVQIMDV